MEQIKQLSSSQKSEMEYENKQAVINNECHKFKTTRNVAGDTARTMKEVMKTNKGEVSIWEWRFAEEYDRAAWFEARAEYLQQRVWELEEQMKFLDTDGKPCDRCNEPVCYEGNEGKISKKDDAVICSECYAREEDEEVEEEEEEEEEVFGKCFECGIIGRFIGKDSDAWLCERCSTIGGCDNDDENDIALHGTCDNCDTILYPDIHIFCFSRGEEDTTFCQECGEDLHEEMNADGWKRDDDEGEINWDEDAHSELCSAIDASGNALF